jgi:hypothetical protein
MNPGLILDLEIVGGAQPARQAPRLRMPDGRPVPVFFGRRFLTYRDLVEIGFVNNAMTLRRLVAEGRFPAPLKFGRKIRLWDALELQSLVDRLATERGAKAGQVRRSAALSISSSPTTGLSKG